MPSRYVSLIKREARVVITLRFCTCINCLLVRILYDKVCGGTFDLVVEVTQIDISFFSESIIPHHLYQVTHILYNVHVLNHYTRNFRVALLHAWTCIY